MGGGTQAIRDLVCAGRLGASHCAWEALLFPPFTGGETESLVVQCTGGSRPMGVSLGLAGGGATPGAYGAWGPARSPDPLLFPELTGLLALGEDRPVRVTQLLPESGLEWSHCHQPSPRPTCPGLCRARLPCQRGQLLLQAALGQPGPPTQGLQSRLAGSGLPPFEPTRAGSSL